jgi:hypothetical protein
MNPTVEQFLLTLFNPDESTCFTKFAKGTSVFPVVEPPPWVQFYSVNPLDGATDHEPIEEYHAVDRPRRADANVVAYRNFLLELDSMPLPDQQPYIEQMQVPVSTCTFSGGKSYHFIVALEESLSSEKEYAFIAQWLHNIVSEADHSTKNPSRLSRFPGVPRIDKNGTEQKLIFTRGRINNAEFKSWLEKHEWAKPEVRDESVSRALVQSGELGSLSKATHEYFAWGAEKGSRNSALYKAARDMLQAGWTEEGATEMLLEPIRATSEYDEALSLQTIRSAFKKDAKYPPRF